MFRFVQHNEERVGFSGFHPSRDRILALRGEIWLLKILNLLANLLEFGLTADDPLRDCGVIRLCSERVEFAENLLRDEFQRAPNGFFPAQMVGKLSQMTFKSRELF